MHRVSKISIALVLAVLSVTALRAAGGIDVAQVSRAFSVANVQITRGEIIHFLNNDRFVHQIYVQSPALQFESDEQPPGSNVDIPFTQAGVFVVRCHIHPKMLLNVEVR